MTALPSPWLTIAIPTLNRASLLVRALESALAQAETGVEIIVSDNGSQDGTPSVLSRFSDPRLRLFRHDLTMPACEHGNFLLAQARGDFFVGLSDDDFLEPDFASAVRCRINDYPEIDFFYTVAWVHYGQVCVPSLAGPVWEEGPKMLANFYAGKREVCWCACVCRLLALRQIGAIPRGRIFGDMFYWTRLAMNGPVSCISTPLSHYSFLRDDNLSTGVSILPWAAETRLLAEGVIAVLKANSPDVVDLQRLRVDVNRFVARSTANQVVWNALRHVPFAVLLRDLWQVRAELKGDPWVWVRALAALLIPSSWLHAFVLRAALRRASNRRYL